MWWWEESFYLRGLNSSCPVLMTFIQQDPDSEAGSTETEVSKVKYLYTFWRIKPICQPLAVTGVLFFYYSCTEVTWEQTFKSLTLLPLRCTALEPCNRPCKTTHTLLMDWKGTEAWQSHVLLFNISTNILPLLQPSWVTATLAADAVTQLYSMCTFLGVAQFAFVHTLGVTIS